MDGCATRCRRRFNAAAAVKRRGRTESAAGLPFLRRAETPQFRGIACGFVERFVAAGFGISTRPASPLAIPRFAASPCLRSRAAWPRTDMPARGATVRRADCRGNGFAASRIVGCGFSPTGASASWRYGCSRCSSAAAGAAGSQRLRRDGGDWRRAAASPPRGATESLGWLRRQQMAPAWLLPAISSHPTSG